MSESNSLSLESPPASGGVLVALSGGPDSTSLAFALAQEPACQPLHLAWVRHGFRPVAADEEAVVHEIGRRLRVPLHVLDDSPAHGRDPSAAIPEGWARIRRYARLAGLARDLGLRVLATAHHRNDQNETRLLQLLRGGGLRGLAGMPVVRDVDGLLLWRPLLGKNREDVGRILRHHGLHPYADVSNGDLRMRRNLMRHRVIPHLGRTDDPLWRRLAYLGDASGRALARLERVLGRWLRDHARPTCLRAAWLLPARPLGALSPALRHHLVELALRENRETCWRLSRRQSSELNRWIDRGGAGSQQIGASRLERSGPWFGIHGPRPLAAPTLHAGGHGMAGTTWRVRESTGSGPGESLNLHGPWTVRPRRPGDRLRLAGRGTRKLKALMLEAGVARMERDAWPLVVDELGIAWIPGIGQRAPLPGGRPVRLEANGLPDLAQRRASLVLVPEPRSPDRAPSADHFRAKRCPPPSPATR